MDVHFKSALQIRGQYTDYRKIVIFVYAKGIQRQKLVG